MIVDCGFRIPIDNPHSAFRNLSGPTRYRAAVLTCSAAAVRYEGCSQKSAMILASSPTSSPRDTIAASRRSHLDKVRAHADSRLAHPVGSTDPAEIVRSFRSFLKIESHRLRMAHSAGISGCETALVRSFVVDLIVQHALEHADPAADRNQTRNGCAVIAIGGYGRAELAPYSDVDLLFLYSGRHGAHVKSVVERMLQLLWDAQLTVGHSFRTVGDCVTNCLADPHFQTALVQTRFLAGNKALYHSLLDALEKDRRRRSDSFLAAIHRERDARYAKFGSSVFLQEPNIKESAGGLRDYHTALWAAYAKHSCRSLDEMRGRGIISESEAARARRAYDFIWRIRHTTHFLKRRKGERLGLEIQSGVAQQFGYQSGGHLLDSEKFMREYYRQARELQMFSELLLARCGDEKSNGRWWRKRSSEVASDPFVIRQGRLQFDGDPEIFSKKLLTIFNAFALAQAARVPFDYRLREIVSASLSSTRTNIRTESEVAQAFIGLLQRRGRAGYALRLMHDAGFIGRLIPEFKRISLLVQHDLYHHYTVDEHTLKATEVLDDLYTSSDRNHSNLRAILEDLENPATLYLALLLHDIGKGQGKGHIMRGVKLAERICRRLNLPAEQARKIVLLVEHHVTMAHVAQRRDLNESTVITEFVTKIGNLDALNMLLLLTYADLNAVGPGVWTEWKGLLIWDLYKRARRLLTGDDAPVDEVAALAQFKEEVAASLAGLFPFSDIERHLALLPERYSRITSAATVAGHIRLLDRLKTEISACEWIRQGFATTELTVCAKDRHGLVADLAGTLAANGIEILSAELNTREDGIAIDSLILRQASTRQAIDIHRYPAIEQALQKALSGQTDVAAMVERWRVRHQPRRTSAAPERRHGLPTVNCDNEASPSSTLVEVHAYDETGLVHKIARTMASLNINIICARIATEKSDALDVFYVTNDEGERLSEEAMRQLQNALMNELSVGKTGPTNSAKTIGAK